MAYSITIGSDAGVANRQRDYIVAVRRALRDIPGEEVLTTANATGRKKQFFSDAHQTNLARPSQQALKKVGALIDSVMQGIVVDYQRTCEAPVLSSRVASDAQRLLQRKVFDRWSILVLAGAYADKSLLTDSTNPVTREDIEKSGVASSLVDAYEGLKREVLTMMELPRDFRVSQDAPLFEAVKKMDRLWWQVMRGTRELYLRQMGRERAEDDTLDPMAIFQRFFGPEFSGAIGKSSQTR